MTDPADPPRNAPAMVLDVDETVPNAARVYDYLLGGYHNFAVDRELGEKMIAGIPLVQQGALNNRAWLNRVVLDSLNGGIRQFLDIGSGVRPWATCTTSSVTTCRRVNRPPSCTSTTNRSPHGART